MDFNLNEEQVALRDSVVRLLAQHYGFDKRRAIAAGEPGWSEPVYRQLAALGVTGLRIAPVAGGFGGSAIDLMPVMQEFGKALLLEPILASAVMGATAVARGGCRAADADLLSAVARGEVILAFAHDEPASRHAPLWIETRAQRTSNGWRLDGRKYNVLHAGAAHRFVISARVGGEAGACEGLGLFLVDARCAGLQLRTYKLIDDSPAGEMRLEDVPAVPLGEPGSAWPAIEGTLNAGIAAVCAEAVGAMEGAYALTANYLNTRRQFGRLIGENQALRHRVAEMVVSLECARSMALLAAVALDDPDAVESSDLMRAKLIIGRHARSLCQWAVQLHGGIGMTEEYAVGHYLRRITVIDQLFGDSASQASRLADRLLGHSTMDAAVRSVAFTEPGHA